MANQAKLEAEYDRIQKTDFWQLFVNELRAAYKVVNSNLATGDIGKPAVWGQLWQEQKRLIERIFNAPAKILKLPEPSRTPAESEPE